MAAEIAVEMPALTADGVFGDDHGIGGGYMKGSWSRFMGESTVAHRYTGPACNRILPIMETISAS